MTRTRRSAKTQGTRFETTIARYLATALNDDRIERRTRNGNHDRGDIIGLRAHGQRLIAECKDTSRLDLPAWTAQAHTEAGHDDALAGVVIHKRRGIANPARQWVTMELSDLLALITGAPPHHYLEVCPPIITPTVNGGYL